MRLTRRSRCSILMKPGVLVPWRFARYFVFVHVFILSMFWFIYLFSWFIENRQVMSAMCEKEVTSQEAQMMIDAAASQPGQTTISFEEFKAILFWKGTSPDMGQESLNQTWTKHVIEPDMNYTTWGRSHWTRHELNTSLYQKWTKHVIEPDMN